MKEKPRELTRAELKKISGGVQSSEVDEIDELEDVSTDNDVGGHRKATRKKATKRKAAKRKA